MFATLCSKKVFAGVFVTIAVFCLSAAYLSHTVLAAGDPLSDAVVAYDNYISGENYRFGGETPYFEKIGDEFISATNGMTPKELSDFWDGLSDDVQQAVFDAESNGNKVSKAVTKRLEVMSQNKVLDPGCDLDAAIQTDKFTHIDDVAREMERRGLLNADGSLTEAGKKFTGKIYVGGKEVFMEGTPRAIAEEVRLATEDAAKLRMEGTPGAFEAQFRKALDETTKMIRGEAARVAPEVKPINCPDAPAPVCKPTPPKKCAPLQALDDIMAAEDSVTAAQGRLIGPYRRLITARVKFASAVRVQQNAQGLVDATQTAEAQRALSNAKAATGAAIQELKVVQGEYRKAAADLESAIKNFDSVKAANLPKLKLSGGSTGECPAPSKVADVVADIDAVNAAEKGSAIAREVEFIERQAEALTPTFKVVKFVNGVKGSTSVVPQFTPTGGSVANFPYTEQGIGDAFESLVIETSKAASLAEVDIINAKFANWLKGMPSDIFSSGNQAVGAGWDVTLVTAEENLMSDLEAIGSKLICAQQRVVISALSDVALADTVELGELIAGAELTSLPSAASGLVFDLGKFLITPVNVGLFVFTELAQWGAGQYLSIINTESFDGAIAADVLQITQLNNAMVDTWKKYIAALQVESEAVACEMPGVYASQDLKKRLFTIRGNIQAALSDYANIRMSKELLDGKTLAAQAWKKAEDLINSNAGKGVGAEYARRAALAEKWDYYVSKVERPIWLGGTYLDPNSGLENRFITVKPENARINSDYVKFIVSKISVDIYDVVWRDDPDVLRRVKNEATAAGKARCEEKKQTCPASPPVSPDCQQSTPSATPSSPGAQIPFDASTACASLTAGNLGGQGSFYQTDVDAAQLAGQPRPAPWSRFTREGRDAYYNNPNNARERSAASSGGYSCSNSIPDSTIDIGQGVCFGPRGSAQAQPSGPDYFNYVARWDTASGRSLGVVWSCYIHPASGPTDCSPIPDLSTYCSAQAGAQGGIGASGAQGVGGAPGGGFFSAIGKAVGNAVKNGVSAAGNAVKSAAGVVGNLFGAAPSPVAPNKTFNLNLNFTIPEGGLKNLQYKSQVIFDKSKAMTVATVRPFIDGNGGICFNIITQGKLGTLNFFDASGKIIIPYVSPQGTCVQQQPQRIMRLGFRISF